MSIINISKKDITNKGIITIKKSDITVDTTPISVWETDNRKASDELNRYQKKISSGEYMSDEDRKAYKSALDLYISTSNNIRRLNSNYSDDDNKAWEKSVADMNENYEAMSGYYSQFKNADEYNKWYESYTKAKEYEAELKPHLDQAKTEEGKQKGKEGWEKYLADEAKKAEVAVSGYEDEKWWETVLRYISYIGGSADTTLPNANAVNAQNALRKNGNPNAKPNDRWDEETKLIFGYLYMNDPDEAFKYAASVGDSVMENAEHDELEKISGSATSGFLAGAGHTAGAIIASPFGMADYLADLVEYNALGTITSDGNVSPFEYSQAVKGGITEHLNEKGGVLNEDIPVIGGKGWGDVYNLGTSTAQSMVSAYTLGPAGTLISYFGQGAAAGVDEALARGASEEQALLYGTVLGIVEGVAEKIGIDNLFKLGASSTVKGVIKNILKQAGAEGSEEFLTAVASEVADRLIMQDMSNFNLAVEQYMAQGMSKSKAKKKAFTDSAEEIAYDTIAGAASGGISGGVHTTAQNITSNIHAKKIYGNGADLVTEALDIDSNNAFAQKMQTKVNNEKALSGGQINRLVEINEQALKTKDKAKIKSAAEARLKELGETGDIGKIADVIAKKLSGEELTGRERSILQKSDYGMGVVQEADPEMMMHSSAKWAESIGTERINTEAYNRKTGEASKASAPATRTASVTENTSTKESVSEGKISASEGMANQPVKAVVNDGEGNKIEINVARIAEVDGGEVILELEGGETVKASDIDFKNSGIGFVYNAAAEMVSRLGGFNVDAANLMVKGVGPNISEAQASTYVAGFSEAYRYGAMGYPVSALATGGATSKLSVSQRETAYNLGKAYGEGKVAEKQAKIDSIVTKKADKNFKKASKKGKVYFDGSAVGKTLTERQRASLKGLRVVAEAMGIDIRVFESEVVDGKRQGANGWYDPVTKEIHLDLHAGIDGNALMLFTGSHELTHHIREVAPAKFKIFADALLEEYTKNGVSIDELISRKLETLEKNGRLEGKTEEEAYDLAYEEVVADACESMLVDSDAIEALSRKIQAKDKGLWETIKDFITRLVNRIRAAYEGVDPDSLEGKLVREMKDSAERLQKLWVDALLEASEANVEQTLGERGIIVDSKTDSASLMSVRDVLTDVARKKVSKALAERFGVTQSEAMEWLKAETSLASLILNPKYSQYLDYTADPNEEAIKSNSDYPQGTVDFSNICKKRRDFTEVMNRVLRNFPNHVFAATDLAKIRTIMEEEGMEVACAICYVEDRRQLDSVVAQDFIDSLALYRKGEKTRPDGKPFNANQLKAFSLIEGDTYTPSIYELISLEGRNSLKAKNPAMEEAWVKFNNARGMQSVRLLLNDAEYKRQILKYSPTVVKRKNDLGGLRIYSFSDMEMFHLIDIIQVITDSATVGLSLQGYTKVNEYAKAVKDTGEKLNRSLIPKGDLGYHIENGRVVLDFDTVEGIDINHPDFFDNIDNPNIGNIVIGINATQIKAAMTSKFIDQIIPFHTGQSNEVLGEKGIAAWENYKDFQSERDVKTNKKSSHQINIYTEVINAAEAEGKPIKNKVDFVNKFLEVCKENNLIPRFSDFLNVDENGDYVYTEGYHKFLVDFKTFDQNTGEYLPQMPVKPVFDNEYITSLLTDYVKSQKVKDAELKRAMPKVLDRITGEIVKSDGVKFSDRDIQKSFGIGSINDYVGVQKAVINTLTKEGFFSDGNNIVVNKDSGMVVEITKDGIRETLGSGTRFQTLPRELKELKLSTIHSLPYLIETAHLDSDDVMNMHNSESKVKYAYLSTDVDVQRESGKSTYTVTITVRKSPQKNKFWIHEIRTTKKEQGLSSGGDVNPQQEYNKTLAQEGIIPQDSDSVKRKFSDRSPDSYSNRSLLAGALETAAQNDIEKQKLAQYKQKIELINAEEQKLHKLREQIKELSFAKGPRDTKAIKDLQLEANQAANRINTYDRQLLNLESTKALKGVLEREKAQARKRAEKQGKEALERYREKAAKTQRELMDHYQESRKKATEGRHKTAMRHKIKDVVNELNQYLLKGTKDKHVPIELQKAVAEALDAVNMDTVGAEERIAKKRAEMMSAKSPEVVERLAKEIERIGEMGGNMEAKLSKLKTAYDSIINSDDPLVANSHDEVISNTIERVMEIVGNTPLRDMSLYQLESVYDMYKMVLHSVRTANKAFKAKKSEEISVIANRVMEEVDKLGKKKALQTKMGEAVSTFDWNNQKPIYAFERIGSGTFAEVFGNVRDSEDVWAVDMTEAKDFLENQKQKHKYNSWDFRKRYAFTSSTGRQFELTLDQIMSLYAYSKRGDQAKDHLKYGGFVYDGLTEVKEKTKLGTTKTYRLKDATAYNLSDEILAEIISKLSPEQKAFADEMQNYLSAVMGEKGNEVSLELYGVKLFKEKNYFPLKSAPQYLERAREQAQGDTKIKNKGFTKETVPKAKNPIVLTSFMDVWAGHVNEMSMYHAFTLSLEDFYRVFNYKTPASETMDSEGVIPFIENAHGSAAVGYIDQLLKDLNGGARSDPRETAAKALMSNFKKASVMASLSVVIQQPSAIVRAEALVDAKYFVGKRMSKGKHKETWAEVKKYAPVAIIKEMGYFDTGMGQSSTDWLKGDKTWKDKMDDAISKAPSFADEVTWCAMWNAVKRETAGKNPHMKTNSEEFLKLAGERFTEVVTKTQVYDSTLARSANMRSKSAFMSMLTAFMAEPTTSINMLQDAFIKGNKKNIARTLGAVYGSVLLNSALVSLIYAMRDDDEDETFLEKYLSRFVTEVVDGVNPLTYIPFVKDIWSALQGFDVERSDMTLITNVIDSMQQLIKVATKDTSDMSEEELADHRKAVNEAILSIMDGLSSLTGVPLKNIRRDFNGIVNGVKTIIKDAKGRKTTAGSLEDNVLEDVKDSVPVWGWLPDESKGDKLYDAIIKGDTAYVDRLKSEYKSEKAYQSAVRKALRENDTRIKEAAEALNRSDYREYDRIRLEIIGEGHFEEKDVNAAIAQEYEKMQPDEPVETKEEKAESDYKVDWVYDAIISGDKDMASVMKEDIINTYIANGKTQKEAESSYKSALRKVLREKDPRIRSAAEAMASGNGKEFSRILNEIADEGNFSRNIISGAIAAEAEKIKDEKK